jgi:hypothetical protein
MLKQIFHYDDHPIDSQLPACHDMDKIIVTLEDGEYIFENSRIYSLIKIQTKKKDTVDEYRDINKLDIEKAYLDFGNGTQIAPGVQLCKCEMVELEGYVKAREEHLAKSIAE